MSIFIFSIIAGVYLTFKALRLLSERSRIISTASMLPGTFLGEVKDANSRPLLFWFGVLLSCWLWIVLGGIAFYFIYDDYNYGYDKILLWPLISAIACVLLRFSSHTVYFTFGR